ncbi:MAG: sulfatase [Bryobacter sp.]
MQRRQFLGSLAAPALAQGAPPSPKAPPNILFITADDLGLQLSCYGEKRIQTPNLDALAARGARFTTAYVAQASCSPSRSAMFTGLYPHANGQYGLTGSGFRLHERLRPNTLPNVLRRAGYRTGIVGKLHVDPESSFLWDFRGPDREEGRRVRLFTQLSREFMDSAKAQPFFLMVNFTDPHAFRNPEATGGWDFPPQVEGLPKDPLPPSESTIFPFQQIDTPEQRIRTAGYYNAVQRLDTGIGMLMQQLEASGKAGNTLIVFCGDHGPPFARGKTTVYEAGLRVPYLLHWPGVTKPNTVSPKLVSTVDIMPTLLDAAGLPAPHRMHGESLRLALGGKPWRQYLGADFHFHGGRPFYPRRALRDQRFQIIHNLRAGQAKPSTGIDGDPAYRLSRLDRFNGTGVRQAFDTFADPPEYELYDTQQDAIAFDNLAGRPQHARTLRRLQAALLDWRKATDDPFLDPAFLARFAEGGA